MTTITRKEIAAAAGVSVRTVIRRERAWGLISCRSTASARPILYFRGESLAALTRAKVLFDLSRTVTN